MEEHQASVAWRVVDCDKDPSVPYDRTFMACAYVIMKSGFVGTALTVARYTTFAQPEGPSSFNTF
ncbi:histidine decarboxylase, pyruvoyl type [Roseibium aggregatum]|nr:histidine decarboxylase, pyruvoyl type [Roseibium aggregatum]WJS05390.1 histidine decarboxylase, pyruvoyl type [Roseibium aggregatum]